MHENLKQTLAFYDIDCNKPYYVSLGSSIFKFHEKPFRIDFYAFGICTAGEITIEIDNREYNLFENSFLIAAPSSTLRIKNVSDNFKMKFLLFEKNFLLKNLSNPFIIEKMLLFQNGTYSLIETNLETLKNLHNLLTYLDEKSKQTGKFTDEITRAIIINILLEIAEITNQNNDNPKEIRNSISDVYLQFRELISENILKNKSVQFYADELNVSNKYLIEIVKKSSDKTPHQIIDEILLNEAYVFLGDTALTISQVAYKLQFNSTSAFGRFFKKHTFLSPSQYRSNENLTH